MKSAASPSAPMEPELHGEPTLPSTAQEEFVARGLRALEDARRLGEYIEADDVMERLQRKLDLARAGFPRTLG